MSKEPISCKPQASNEYERIVWMHNHIKNGYLEYSDYKFKFGVSRRTFDRDLCKLKYYFKAPVVCSDGRYKYEVDTYELPAMLLSEKDLFGLMMSIHLVGTYRDSPMYDSLHKITKRLADMMSTDISYFYVDSTNITNNREVNWEHVQKVIQAIYAKNSIEIVYQSFNSAKTTKRVVDPYHIFYYNNEFYFVGWCYRRKAFRDFFVGRIKRFYDMSPRKQDHKFNKDEYFNSNNWGIIKGQKIMRVVFKVNKEKDRWIHEQYSHKLKLISRGNKWITYSLDTSVDQELVNWILSYGKYIQVLKPTALVKRVQNHLISALSHYE